MKKHIIFAACAAMALTACIGDLDQAPLSDTTIPGDGVYSNPVYRKGALSKIYGGFTLVGQSGAGSADIAVGDAGASEYLRALWAIQTVSTDEAWCVWGDAWASEISKNTWTSTKNDAIYAAYTRAVMMVAFANEFLRNTTDDDAEIAGERAEVRFLRAYAYWTLLDCFGNPPFTDETTPIGDYKPEQIAAPDLFKWLYDELQSLVAADSNLKEPHTQVYPRVDKGAAYGLLARLCLNHKTYLGTEERSYYTDAMNAADQVIAAYPLATNYEALFMGDNGENPDALQELVYTSCYDAAKTQSYGGATFIIAASKNTNDVLGLQANWSGLVTSSELVANFIGDSGVENAATGADPDFTAVDRRALFSLKYCDDKTLTAADFTKGWHVWKFNNNHFLNPGVDYGQTESFTSIDFPMIRAGEMYLVYAEAKVRYDGGQTSDTKAVKCIADLQRRAGLSPSMATITLEDCFTECTRELCWEGHRRTTLIRYDRFSSASYLWPYKGGAKQGQAFSSHMELYPLPSDDLQANGNLEQNPRY